MNFDDLKDPFADKSKFASDYANQEKADKIASLQDILDSQKSGLQEIQGANKGLLGGLISKISGSDPEQNTKDNIAHYENLLKQLQPSVNVQKSTNTDNPDFNAMYKNFIPDGTNPPSDDEIKSLYEKFGISPNGEKNKPFVPPSLTPALKTTSPETPEAPKIDIDAIKEKMDMENFDSANRFRNSEQLRSDILKSVGGLSNALAGKNASSDMLSGVAKSTEERAGQPLADILARQKMSADQLAQKIQGMQAKKMQSSMDPNSAESKAFRSSIEALYPGVVAKYGNMWKNVTSGDQDLVFKPLELKEKMDARKDAMTIAMKTKLDERNNQHKLVAQKSLNNDKTYTKSIDAINAADELIASVRAANKDNPIDAKGVSILLAKTYVAGAGRLNQQELAAFRQPGGLYQQAEQLVRSMASGRVTDANKNAIEQVALRLKEHAQKVKDEREHFHVGQHMSVSKSSYDDAYKDVLGTTQPTPSGAFGIHPDDIDAELMNRQGQK